MRVHHRLREKEVCVTSRRRRHFFLLLRSPAALRLSQEAGVRVACVASFSSSTGSDTTQATLSHGGAEALSAAGAAGAAGGLDRKSATTSVRSFVAGKGIDELAACICSISLLLPPATPHLTRCDPLSFPPHATYRHRQPPRSGGRVLMDSSGGCPGCLRRRLRLVRCIVGSWWCRSGRKGS